MNTHTEPLLVWEAKAKIDHERSGVWYLVGGVLCGVMILYGILFGVYTVSVVFLLLPAAYYLVRHQQHRTHTARILETGFELDGVLTPWNELKDFWILRGNGYHELHIAPQSGFRGEIVIQTGEIDPYLVRDALLLFLEPGTQKREKVLDALIRFTKL